MSVIVYFEFMFDAAPDESLLLELDEVPHEGDIVVLHDVPGSWKVRRRTITYKQRREGGSIARIDCKVEEVI